MPGVRIDKIYCKGCDLCVRACPMQILGMSKEINLKGYFYAILEVPTKCIGCQMCAIVCPEVAIEVYTHGTLFKLFQY